MLAVEIDVSSNEWVWLFEAERGNESNGHQENG